MYRVLTYRLYRKAVGLDDLIYKMEYWANYTERSRKSNRPVAVLGPTGSGKTLFLHKWLEHHRANPTSVFAFYPMRLDRQQRHIHVLFGGEPERGPLLHRGAAPHPVPSSCMFLSGTSL